MKVKQIKPNSIINVAMSTEFYRQVQNLVFYFTDQQDKDTIQAAVLAIQKESEKDPSQESGLDSFQESLRTLLVLTNTMEQAFLDGDYIEEIEIPDHTDMNPPLEIPATPQ